MIETIIILSVLVIILIAYIIVNNLNLKKKIELERKNACDELFSMMLKGGYEKRVNDFKIYNKEVKKEGIVFVGDSLTENYNVYEYFKDYNVYNRGIGGDTTSGLLNRMKESIYDLEPKVVVLLIGINDFQLVENADVNTIFNNIKLIIKNIKENCPNTKIILESLYPISKEENPKIDKLSVGIKDNNKILELNELLKTIEGVNYLDVNSSLQDKNGNIQLDYTVEGLHVNTYGYTIITNIIKGKLEEIKNLLWELEATGIICDDELTPVQLGNMEDALDTKVMDRTLIILDIFAGRAQTNEGKFK